MKKGKTYVDRSKVLAVLDEMKIEYKEQSGFFRVDFAPGRRIYVAKTNNVARIDLSGFEVDVEEFGVVSLGGNSFGAVKQQVDFSPKFSEDDILSNFRKIVEHAKTLGERKIERVAPPKKRSKKEVEQGARKKLDELDANEKAAKLALIERVSKEKNIPISEKTIDQLTKVESKDEIVIANV